MAIELSIEGPLTQGAENMSGIGLEEGSPAIVVTCVAITQETDQAKTYVFRPDDGRRVGFEPGQFMNLTFAIGRTPHTRSYSISSSSQRGHTFSITVKRVEGGLVSNWLFNELRVGDRITAEGPVGAFTSGHVSSNALLFLSAGSGITPLASMMRSLIDAGANGDVAFLHFASSPEEMIFLAEMGVWSRSLPRARIIPICTRPKAHSGWLGPVGRLNRALLLGLVPDLAARRIFCCGPEGFMAEAKRIALNEGLSGDAFHEESFAAFDALAESGAEDLAETTQSFELEFMRTKRTIECAPGSTILKAAQKAKIPIQTSCGKGICGTCRIKLVSGTVDMAHGGGIKQREIDQGWILACCSRPTSDLRIEK
jgi:ferredoxin-NADP reductase